MSTEINETEVWVKFSATHSYQRGSDGIMRLRESKYFRLDPFGVEPSQEVTKDDLITSLDPDTEIPG